MRHRTEPFWKELPAILIGIILLILMSPLLVVLGVGLGVKALVWGPILTSRFRRTSGRQGKVAVLVYSDSPHWKQYIEERMLPPVRDRVVTLNWSLRSQWKKSRSLEVKIFEHWGGRREFNPMAIIIPPRGQVRLLRFWPAFMELKHGKPQSVESLCQEFHEAIRAA